MLHRNIMIVSGSILLMALSIPIVSLQSAVADTLTNPGQTVTFPNEGNSRSTIGEHIGKGAPCEAFGNENNPVTADFSSPNHPHIC
jgi:hypothetical protein